jgi:predicted RNA binding protein YcfA (HicA-like mRNA interferase family)
MGECTLIFAPAEYYEPIREQLARHALPETGVRRIGHRLKVRELVKLLEEEGWRLVRVSGSHHHFAKPGARNIITVPIHSRGRDVPPGLLRAILKAAKIKERR